MFLVAYPEDLISPYISYLSFGFWGFDLILLSFIPLTPIFYPLSYFQINHIEAIDAVKFLLFFTDFVCQFQT